MTFILLRKLLIIVQNHENDKNASAVLSVHFLVIEEIYLRINI